MQYTSKATYEFISKQTNDPIVERKICRVSGAEFPIFQSEIDFYDKISPTFADKKFQIPTPTLCPEERERRRRMHRNERHYYRRTCQFSGEPTVSLHTPDKPRKVYKNKIWFSDKRDAMDYAQDISSDIGFTEQFLHLEEQVPTPDMMRVDSENCDYTSGTWFCKNCYMICASEYAENCMYSKLCQTASYVLDSSNIFNSEHIYQSYNLKECNNCIALSNSIGCYHSHFSDSLIWCSYCLFCTNLQNKSYHIFNKPISKQEFEQAYERYLTSNIGMREGKAILSDCLSRAVSKYVETERCENSCGNELFDCKNVIMGYSVNEWEDCRYCAIGEKVKSVQDCNNMYVNPELCYEVMWAMQSYNCHFSCYIFENSRDIWYSVNCHNCHNCFWCIGLRSKSYCIFNKQYSKEEYELRVAEIIDGMIVRWERWEFFDYILAPFGYNESVAQDIYPLTKQEALARWYRRSEYSNDPKIPDNAQVIKVVELSDNERDSLSSDPTILRQVIICAESWRPFMIQKSELSFYHQHKLPLPRIHPDVRYLHRVRAKPSKALYLRNCDCCGKEMLSVYSHNHTWKIYCEECYNKEIYS